MGRELRLTLLLVCIFGVQSRRALPSLRRRRLIQPRHSPENPLEEYLFPPDFIQQQS